MEISNMEIRYSTPNWDFLRMSLKFCMMKLRMLCDILSKFQEYLPSIFFSSVMKIMFFYKFNDLKKRAFNSKDIKIHNEANLTAFLSWAANPPNTNILHKYADWK